MCLTICADIVCCTGTTICQGCCLCCRSCCGSTTKQQVKLTYIIIQAIAMAFTLVFLYYASYALDPFSSYVHCSEETGGKWVCLGVSSVYRMSLSLAILHFIIFISCLTRSELAKSVNEGCWLLKILIIFVLWVLFFFVPNSFFEGYSDFAKFIGGLFLLFQIIMIIDLCYMWGESWIDKYESGNRIFGVLLVVFTVILSTCNLVLNIYMFIWFGFDSSCGLNIFLIVFNLIITIILNILTISGIAKNGSLLTIGAYSIYISYMLWSGLASSPDTECNKLYFNSSVMIVGIVFGIIFILISLCYLTFNTSKTSAKRIKFGANNDVNSNLLDNNENQISPLEESRDNSELSDYKNNIYIAFHFVMIICAVYISMMLTNWGSPKINDTGLNKFIPGWTSFWIQVVASWVGALVYIWTIVAQKIFPDREFMDEENF